MGLIAMKKMSTLITLMLPLLFLVFGSASAQSRVRICYFTNWSQGRPDYARFLPVNIDPFLCTHITFAYAGINDTTNSLQTTAANDLELYGQAANLKFLNPDLKVLLSVGGLDETQGLNRRFEAVARNNASTDAFARNVITWLRQYRFDGLGVDWEWPDETTRTIFQSFVQRIRAAFDNETMTAGRTRLLLTVAVNATHNTVDSRYQPSVIAPYVDYIEIMSFEYFGVWEPLLAHHSPLYPSGRFSMHQTVQAFLNSGAPKNKLVLGFATYGRAVKLYSAELKNVGNNYTRQWTSPGRLTQKQGFLSYYEICEKVLEGWTREFLDESQVPIAYSTSSLEWVCYDEPVSFTSKAEYVVSQNLAGAMVWTLDLDDFSSRGCGLGYYPLTSAIREVFERNATPAPKTPRPSTTTTTTRTATTTRLTTTTAVPPTTTTTARTTTTPLSTTRPTTTTPTTTAARTTTPMPTAATTTTITTPATTRTTTPTPTTATTTTIATLTTRTTTPTPPTSTTTTIATLTTRTTTPTPQTSTTTTITTPTTTTRTTTPMPTAATTTTITTPTTTKTTILTPTTATTTTITTPTTKTTTPTSTTATTTITTPTRTTTRTTTPMPTTATTTTITIPTTTRTTTPTQTTTISTITTKPTTMTTTTATTTATKTTTTTRPSTATTTTRPTTTTTALSTPTTISTTITTTTTPLRTTTTSTISTRQSGDTSQLPKTSSKPVYDGGYNCPTMWGQYAYPNNCNRFVICVFGSAVQFTCGPDRHYSESLQVCVWPYSCEREQETV